MKKYRVSFRDRLRNYKPFFFDNRIEWDKVFALYITINDSLNCLGKRHMLESFLYALDYAFFDKFQLEFNGKGRMILFYGLFNWRKDHYSVFKKFSSKFDFATVAYPKPIEKKIQVLRGLQYLIMMLVWIMQALLCGYGIKKSFVMLRTLVICNRIDDFVEKLLSNDETLFVTYYDASPDEAYCVQKAKIHGKVTATLQHGIFCRKERQKALSDTAFEYSESNSDYYLGWNQYTKDEWSRIGLDENKFIMAGIPRYIDHHFKTYNTNNCSQKKIFGVMLNNSSFDLHNKSLIKMANLIAESYNIKYVVRYHPELIPNSYDDLIDKKYFYGVSDNNMSIESYSNTVDFTIISSSRVMVDLVYLNKNVYRLKVTNEDTYNNINDNAFSTINEFRRIVNNSEGMEKVRRYLCTIDDVKETYSSIFKDLSKRVTI